MALQKLRQIQQKVYLKAWAFKTLNMQGLLY